jgi:ribose transport system substrate-binding protein
MRTNAYRKAWLPVAAAVVAATVMSGCSSSGSGGSPSTGSNPTSAGASVASGSGVSAALKASVASYTKTPTTIRQTVPLTGKVPTDKTWVVITCELPQCHQISDGALAAAKAAGVPTKLLSYMTTDATTMVSAMKQALTFHPFAVSPIGLTQAVWNPLQSQYKSAGVSITPLDVGDTTPSDVVTQGSGSQLDFARGGSNMADYVIADSNASAHILVQDVPAFAVLKAYGDGFRDEISKQCSNCKVTSLNVTPAQVASNGVVSAVVAALQKDHSIKYLASTDGTFLTGISTALKAAGLSGIKIVGGSPSINNLTDLKSGNTLAWTGADEEQYGWVGMDIVLRTALKMTVPSADSGSVLQILTKDNVGTPSPTGLSAPKDYQAQFEKLWGV